MLLTGEEINELTEVWFNADEDVDWAITLVQAQLKKIVEWGNERCPHFEGTIGGQTPTKRECYHCWQTLLDAVK